MAQPYTGLPQYGVNYSTTPQYPAYNPTATPTVPPSLSNFHQQNAQTLASQAPVMQANDLRFHANMQIPPPSNFPFPSSLSADMLKHFPPPPPPPPLPAAFPSGSGTPIDFSQMPENMKNGFQSYPQHTYSNPIGIPGTTPSIPAHTPFYNPAAIFNPQVSHDGGQHRAEELVNTASPIREPYDPRQPSHQRLLPDIRRSPNNQEIHVQADAQQSQTSSMHSTQYPQARSASVQSNVTSTLDDYDPNTTLTSYAELREQAKAAILSLASHKVTYEDFMAEGIQSEVLETLFLELGLERSEKAGLQTTLEKNVVLKDNTTVPPIQTTALGQSLMKPSIVPPPINSNQSPATLAVERKDRIAQLLAAKAAKNNTAGAVSPSQTPPSASDTGLSQKANVSSVRVATTNQLSKQTTDQDFSQQGLATSRLVQEQLAILRQTGGSGMQPNAPESSSFELNEIPLPTPIRTALAQNGLSTLIPGLFMGNDEEEPAKQESFSSLGASVQIPEKLPQSSNQIRNGLSQKRPASPSPTAAEQERISRRRVSSVSGPGDIEMDLEGSESGEASEGEIVEHVSPPQKKREGQNRQSHGNRTHFNATIYTQAQIPDGEKQDIASTDYRPRSTGPHLANSRAQSFPSSPGGSTANTPVVDSASHSSLRNSSAIPPRTEASATKAAIVGQRPISRLTPAQLAERAAQLKADLVRQRKIRQQQMNEGIPALDEEVLKTQQRIAHFRERLEAVRMELQKYENEVARAKDDEQQILMEIEGLEKQLHQGMTGQKRVSEEFKNIAPQSVIELSSKATGTESQIGELLPVSIDNKSMHQAELRRANDRELTPGLPQGQARSGPGTNDTAIKRVATDLEAVAEPDEVVLNISGPEAAAKLRSFANVSASPIAGVLQREQQKPESSLVTVDTPSSSGLDYVSDQRQNDGEVTSQAGDSMMSIDDESEAESDGSASMSDSGSDDYEPAEPDSILEPEIELQSRLARTRNESEEYDPEDNLQGDSRMNDLADDYEPSEQVYTEVPGVTSVRPDKDADRLNLHQTSGHSEQENNALPITRSENNTEPAPDDQETGLQLSEANTMPKDLAVAEDKHLSLDPEFDPNIVDGNRPTHFVPYQSPLSSFKSYRFHPSFTDQVHSGFRSLTYSNKIDPKQPICPAELAGEVCTDADCEEQHFGSMILTDDKILVQMSSAHDIIDKNLRDEFLRGLKQVIGSLRQNGVKEFSQVAAALSQYRREWSAAHSSI